MKRIFSLSLLFIITALNILGCSNLPTTKSQSVTPEKEIYTVIKGQSFQSKGNVLLKTVAAWSGEESKNIKYKATKSPWVINYGYTPISRLSNKLEVNVYKRLNSDIMISMNAYGVTMIEDTGDFDIQIESSGCKWWVKIGIE